MAQTGTVIPNEISDSILEIYTDVDQWVSFHTGEPGKTGANESPTLGRQKIEASTGWTEPADDVSSGGRLVSNTAQLDYGEATAVEQIAYFGFWSDETGGTFRGGAPVTTPQSTVVGNPVFVPVGAITVAAAGR